MKRKSAASARFIAKMRQLRHEKQFQVEPERINSDDQRNAAAKARAAQASQKAMAPVPTNPNVVSRTGGAS
jgi:hypothetical protein